MPRPDKPGGAFPHPARRQHQRRHQRQDQRRSTSGGGGWPAPGGSVQTLLWPAPGPPPAAADPGPGGGWSRVDVTQLRPGFQSRCRRSQGDWAPDDSDRDAVLMEQLHDVSCWLLDMPCCQTDLGVRLDEEGAGERDGRGEAFGDGAGDRGQV